MDMPHMLSRFYKSFAKISLFRKIIRTQTSHTFTKAIYNEIQMFLISACSKKLSWNKKLFLANF